MAKHTNTPWVVYQGGNFVRIGAWDYIQMAKATNYLGGPLSIAEMDCYANYNHDLDMERAVANAELIVRAVNAHDDFLAACKAALPFVQAANINAEDGAGEANVKLTQVIRKAEGQADE